MLEIGLGQGSDSERIIRRGARWHGLDPTPEAVARHPAGAARDRTHAPPGGTLGEHLENARRMGLRRYLRIDEIIHCNTDGPRNPFSRVYDLKVAGRRAAGLAPVGAHAGEEGAEGGIEGFDAPGGGSPP